MHKTVVDLLICPLCHGLLDWTIEEQDERRILQADAYCSSCDVHYPVRDGIGLFVTPTLRKDDLWEEAASGLMGYLRANPEIERALMEQPLDALTPADQMLRTMWLEDQGNFEEAKRVADVAMSGLYTPEYVECFRSQTEFVYAQVASHAPESPILDIASGRGYLVERLLALPNRLVIATDVSPRILRRDRQYLSMMGLYDRVTLLAFDARQTPFKAGSIQTMTTNLGLPNIDQPDLLLWELRRICEGTLFAINHFLPPNDTPNIEAISAMLPPDLLIKSSTTTHFAEAGWKVELANLCSGIAQPTPPSTLIEGLKIDTLPATETVFDWCVLVATPAEHSQ
ncbi:MAG: methyltransferase domain-containing protein [Anaerolineae bacterium]|nr:methyltransferase domain-containing protein [Anaerolineae bacterium]